MRVLRGERRRPLSLSMDGVTQPRAGQVQPAARGGAAIRGAVPVFDLAIQASLMFWVSTVFEGAATADVAQSVLIAWWPLCFGLTWLLASSLSGLFRPGGSRSWAAQWKARAQVSGWVFLAMAAAGLLGVTVPSGWFAISLLALSATAGGAFGAAVHHVLLGRPGGRERAVLIGTAGSIARAAERLDVGRRHVDVVGTVELPEAVTAADVQSHEARVLATVSASDADLAVLTTDPAELGIPAIHLVWALETTGAQVLLDTGLNSLRSNRVALRWLGGLVTVVARPRPARTLGTALSAALQWAIATLGLLALTPLMAVVAVAIKSESSGPVFFVQRRVGLRGRSFPMIKFRTMLPDADSIVHLVAQDDGAPDRGPMFKAKADPRITRVGRILRRFSLDELPQLINVVLGHMLLVGPRPALDREVCRYDGYERRRLDARPGLTGLWQVSGRSDLDWQRSVELDQTYVDGRTLALDMAILAKTPRAVLGGRGAY